MAYMPDWFAKTPEMHAADLYFSVEDAGSQPALADRYKKALWQLQIGAPGTFFRSSKALDAAAATGALQLDPTKVRRSLDTHFVGDWVYYLYPGDPARYANTGGRFWPRVGSQWVVDVVRTGNRVGMLKALGIPELSGIGFTTRQIDRLYLQEYVAGLEPNDLTDVRPMATTWNCVAPMESDYFQAAALRGPSVVELAIATPKPESVPLGWPLIEEVILGSDALDAPDLPQPEDS